MAEIKRTFAGGKMNKDVDIRLMPKNQYRHASNIKISNTDEVEGSALGVDSDGADGGTVQNLLGNSVSGAFMAGGLDGGYPIGGYTKNYLLSINTESGLNVDYGDMVCVGSVADPKGSAYFLFTDKDPNVTGTDEMSDEDETEFATSGLVGVRSKADFIIKKNQDRESYNGSYSSSNQNVVIDLYRVDAKFNLAFDTASLPNSTSTININMNSAVDSGANSDGTDLTFPFTGRIRENMTVKLFTNLADTDPAQEFKIKKIDGNIIRLYDPIDTTSWTSSSFNRVVFEHPRVLKFKPDVYITGLNVIDNLLFFTDGINEPKKINIDRCIKGTPQVIEYDTSPLHTQLFVADNNNDLVDAGDLEFQDTNGGNVNNDLLEEHLTVLRPAPKTAPTVHAKVRDISELKFVVNDYLNSTGDIPWISSGEQPQVGEEVYIGVSFDTDNNQINTGIATPELSQIPLEQGDILSVTQENSEEGFDAISFKVEFLSYLDESTTTSTFVNFPTNKIRVKIITVPENEITEDMTSWEFKVVDLGKSKFELKFARFAYRYKYEDGEYSAFSPFSEIAFDPGRFDYDVKKGFNLGMVNTIKELTIKDFIPYYTDRALDVKEVEILYKSTDNPNVYSIKNIKKVRDNEWKLFTPNDDDVDNNNTTQNSIETGSLKIKSENIHRVLPANQTLRAFDNVPRYAKAQEITASRILYGNYVQGFDLKYPVGLNQNVTSEVVNGQPKRSVKTIRDYKVGMVFGDKYGRETPVIVSNRLVDLDSDPSTTEYLIETDDVRVPKNLAALSNKLTVQQDWNKLGLPAGNPDTMRWMDYVKYYVKETSNEYYNLVMDRWYYAEERENIWLSFPSADRNKVDIETYLELKKAHGEEHPVLEEARYKIIAIENEAPDFIKIDARDMGEVELSDENVIDGGGQLNNADPNLLIDNERGKRIKIDSGNYNNFLDLYGDNLRGQLFARIVGKTVNEPQNEITVNKIVSGDFKKVTHFNKFGTSGEEDAVISFNKSFGESANMRARFVAADFDLNTSESDDSPNDLRYFMEFREEVVENRPEFDGRFFVLIEKDEQIEKHIENIAASGVQFVEIDQIAISYVDTQTYNPAQSGPFSIGATNPGNDAFATNGGVYLDLDLPGGPTITDTSASASTWWGFGNFSETPDISGSPLEGSNDPDQVNLFALGCRHNDFKDDDGNTIKPFDVFGTDNENKTANYGQITKNYWDDFRSWHKSSGTYQGTAERGVNIRNRVFLDGARAVRYEMAEFGTNITNTEEMGIRMTTDSTQVITNDDTEYSNPPAIYNYKPTALDSSIDENATGMCRMVFSQVKASDGSMDDFSGESSLVDGANELVGVGSALSIYDKFTKPGTYFSFLDDNTNDGKPHVYVTVDRSPDDESITLPIQKSSLIKNFARDWSEDNDFDSSEGDNEYGQNDNEIGFRSVKLSTSMALINNNNPFGPDLANPTSTAYSNDSFTFSGTPSSGNNYITFGGENANCVDADGNTIDCFELLGTPGSFYVPNAANEGWIGNGGTNALKIKIGTVENNPEGQSGNSGRFKDQKICGSCVSSDPGCNRHSIRFEFRKVDPETGSILNEGITNLEEFDPRGWAKHDGTAGRIRIGIMQRNTNLGGEIIEVEEDRGIWETEPKEGEELDLYYEASHALPMVLKQGNTLAFAPLKSKVLSQYSDVNGDIQVNNLTVDIDGNVLKDVVVGGVEYTSSESIIKVISTNTDGVTNIHNTNIGIGSHMLFEHTSGLITRSVVEKYYNAPSSSTSNVTYTPATTIDVTITFDGVVTDTLPQGTISITNQDGSAFDESQLVVDGVNVGHGASIVGDNVPGNIFLKHFPEVNNQLTDVTWLPNFEGDGENIIGSSDAVFNATLHFQTGYYQINKDVYKEEVKLGWHNCYSFGNGVESDRIRDDFNAPQIDNGVRVSTTIDDFGQENKTSSIIFSGLYNTTSGVNDLNEFNMGEKIIKDINPDYGSIQALKTRDTNVVVFCENRILKILANKEAVFNADGNSQLTATDRVLGQVSTFLGEYGISKNPESIAVDGYRIYFTDANRSAVLRLSMDGLTPISDVGMKYWFRDHLRTTDVDNTIDYLVSSVNPDSYSQRLLGTFDVVNGDYNLTISTLKKDTKTGFFRFSSHPVELGKEYPTVSWNESSKGWISFKTFAPESGLSFGSKYITVKDGLLYTHNINSNRNNFYNKFNNSEIVAVFNDSPSTVKSFKAMNYEGSLAAVRYTNTQDDQYDNLVVKKGWACENVQTDLESAKPSDFKNKEGKWFARLGGSVNFIDNSLAAPSGTGYMLDSNENEYGDYIYNKFPIQGLGRPTNVEFPPAPPTSYTFKVQNDTTNDND